MDPIGASNTWRWIPYHNSWVDLNGRKVASVSGGTRWGGGMWINAMDMARFGYLWLRGGKWGDKQIIPPAFVKEALTPGGAANSPGNGYGYLWWLNTHGQGTAGPADQRVFGERRRQQHHHGVARPRPRRGVALAPGQRRRVRQARRCRDQARRRCSVSIRLKADSTLAEAGPTLRVVSQLQRIASSYLPRVMRPKQRACHFERHLSRRERPARPAR